MAADQSSTSRPPGWPDEHLESQTRSRWFLTDPNYYRLSYQLAAQYMSAALSPERHNNAGLVQKALETAERLIVEAEQTSEDLATRKRSARKWRPWRALDPAEDRLLRFLDRTIIPCAVLVIAGAFEFMGDPEEAEHHADPIRQRAARANLSYRTLYNLACYEASRIGARMSFHIDVDEPRAVALALAYLDDALTQAPDDRAVELARWAKEDPSLQWLPHDARIHLMTIVNRYVGTGTDVTKPGAAQ